MIKQKENTRGEIIMNSLDQSIYTYTDITLSIYQSANNSSTGKTCTLESVVKRIRDGNNRLIAKTEKCRQLAQADKKAYRKYKESNIPATTFSGMFDIRQAEKLKTHSGLITIDLDDCDVADVMSQVTQMPECVFAYRSPSGQGVKAVFAVDPIPKNDAEHKDAFNAVKTKIEHIAEVDASGKDVSRLCLLAYDPQAFYNPSPAQHFTWTPEPVIESKTDNTTPTNPDDIDLSVLDYIGPDNDYDTWIRVGMAIKNEGLDFSVWDTWSKRGEKYNADEMLKKWDSFKGNGITWATVVSLAKESGYKPKPKPKSEFKPKSDKQTEKQSDSPFFNGKKFLPMGMESYLISKDKRYISLPHEKGLRLFHEGIYVKDKELPKREQLITQIQHALGGELFKHSHFKETENMLNDATTPISECDPSGFLCVKNGILNLDTMKLIPHTPDKIFLSKIPVVYEKDNAKCADILKWLDDVLDGDDDQVNLFLECVGYTLLQTSALQKMIILEGPTKTGKSTAAKLLQHLLGKDNISNVSLHALDSEDNRFSRVKLHGKIANISTDMSQKILKGDGYVKAIVAGDPIEAEHKGKDLFSFIPNATLWAMTNKIPPSYDKTSAWYERLLIMRFDKQFLPHTDNPPDTNILDKIATPSELTGLLTLSIAQAKKALARGAFSTTEKQTQAVREVITRNDMIFSFVDTLNPSRTEWNDIDFYDLYTQWSESEGLDKPLSKTKLADACKLHGIIRVRSKKQGERFFLWKRSN